MNATPTSPTTARPTWLILQLAALLAVVTAIVLTMSGNAPWSDQKSASIGAQNAAAGTPLAADGPAKPAGTLKGDWKITAMSSQKLSHDYTLKLDGSVFVMFVCNSFRGGYTADDATMTVTALASTRKGCPGPEGQDENLLGNFFYDQKLNFTVDGDSATITNADGVKVTLQR